MYRFIKTETEYLSGLEMQFYPSPPLSFETLHTDVYTQISGRLVPAAKQ